MERCKNNCTVCNGDQCDIRIEKCLGCGEEFKIGELWTLEVGDEKFRFCLRCMSERIERFDGKIKPTQRT